jgi:hypothetical protein
MTVESEYQMNVESWSQRTLSRDLSGKVQAIIPVVAAAFPEFQACWRPGPGVEVARQGLGELQSWLKGDAVDTAVAQRCLDLALAVGEDGQRLDGEDGAMSTHLVTSLLATFLASLADLDCDVELDEALSAIPLLAEAYPEQGVSWRSVFISH